MCMHVCMYACMNLHASYACRRPLRPEHVGTGVVGYCEPPDVGTGN